MGNNTMCIVFSSQDPFTTNYGPLEGKFSNVHVFSINGSYSESNVSFKFSTSLLFKVSLMASLCIKII